MSSLAREQMLDRWGQFYEARTDWAERAVAGHLEGFDPEVRERLAARDRQATIALYGPTQVGKTTLILKMLGVADSAALKVGEVLRGGRPAGESATATAMRYRISDDDGWAWVDGGDLLTGASEHQIGDRLRALRASVETGSRDPGRAPVEVGIPRVHLHADAAPMPIRVIDLPGIQSENAVEQAHVRDLAGTYLPHADVIVILGKADSLEFLKPEVLAMPGLLDWWVAPHRFRIVLTHAHLLGSAMEFVGSHPAEHQVPLHDIRTHYLQQVQTHDFPADIDWDRLPGIIYPLEYGRSWAALSGDDARSNVRRKVAHANSTAFDELRGSLTALASAEARLAQTYHAYEVAAAVPRRHYQQEEAALRKMDERAGQLTDQIAARSAEADLVRQRRCKDRGTLAVVDQRVRNPPGWPEEAGLRGALWEAQGDKWLHNRGRFRNVADAQLEDAYRWRVVAWTQWAEPLLDMGILDDRDFDRAKREADRVIRNTREDARTHIRNAWYRDTTWFNWPEWPKGSPEQATETAVHWFHHGVKGIEDAFRALVPKAEAKRCELEARIEQDTTRIDVLLAGQIADLNHQLTEQGERVKANQERMRQLQQQAESAAARGGEFDDLLVQARIQRDLQDLDLLSQAETRAGQQLRALNHLLTLRTYDRIRGSR